MNSLKKTSLREQLEKAEAEAKKLRGWETRAATLRRKIRAQEFEERKALEALEIESTKAALAKEHAVPRDAAFEEAWRMAWADGVNEMYEVRNNFREFINLVKLARKP